VPLELANYERRVQDAVQRFWATRQGAQARSAAGERPDAGQRGAVTSGGHLGGFVELIEAIVVANGLKAGDVKTRGCVLPGYFRATKNWDVLVIHRGVLVAAIELKSQVGSFGNNFNNRAEEVLGSAADLWTTFREGAFHAGIRPGAETPRPFLGWIMILEDSLKVTVPVSSSAANFPVFAEFEGASYQRRYELLCEKLVSERLYQAAALLVTPQRAVDDGAYRDLGLRLFVTELAAHVAKVAALTE
jgi:Restriction endonuclease XhoI